MSGHIIAAFTVVLVIGFTFFHEPVEEALEILPHGRVCIFVDGQPGRSVFDENMNDAADGQFACLLQNKVGNQVEAAPEFREGDMIGLNH